MSVVQFASKQQTPFIELVNEDLELLMDVYESIECGARSKVLMQVNGIMVEVREDDLEELHDLILKKSFDEGLM